jgi:hypothetical protein
MSQRQRDKSEDNAMGKISIRLDEDLVESGRVAAKAELRTAHEQIEFWARVGRAALEHPDLPAAFIAECLASMDSPRGSAIPFRPATPRRDRGEA